MKVVFETNSRTFNGILYRRDDTRRCHVNLIFVNKRTDTTPNMQEAQIDLHHFSQEQSATQIVDSDINCVSLVEASFEIYFGRYVAL